MRRIGFNNNGGGEVKYFIVDDDDYQKVKRHKWFLLSSTAATVIKNKGIYRNVTISRFLFGDDDTVIVRFLNGNPLDARRCNLIACKKRNCSKIEQNGNRN